MHGNVSGFKFRKRPVVIEAVQLSGLAGSFEPLPQWYSDAIQAEAIVEHRDGSATVTTLEGPLIAQHGDWILRGVKGELYPCRSDIFEMTYEKVDTEPSLPAPDHDQTFEFAAAKIVQDGAEKLLTVYVHEEAIVSLHPPEGLRLAAFPMVVRGDVRSIRIGLLPMKTQRAPMEFMVPPGEHAVVKRGFWGWLLSVFRPAQ